MATNNRNGLALGWFPTGSFSTSTTALSAAANWFALSFVPDQSRTLSAVRAYVSAVAGTLGASDITCDLYDATGSSGFPGSALESGKVPSATITAAGWYDFTGFTTALTANTQYWAVFKNVNGTPASNNATFRTTQHGGWPLLGNSTNALCWGRASTTNSGVSWTPNTLQTGVRIAYSGGLYDGMPISNAAAAAVGDGVYATRESGVVFTSPANAILKVAGLALMDGLKVGTPTGSSRLGLWTGSTPTLAAYTNSIPLASQNASGQWLVSYFSSTQTIQPGSVVRVTLGETTQSDTNSNYYHLAEFSWDTDSNSLALLPFGGTVSKTYFDGSSWTDTAGSIFPFALLLDTSASFGAAASGGGGSVLGGVLWRL